MVTQISSCSDDKFATKWFCIWSADIQHVGLVSGLQKCDYDAKQNANTKLTFANVSQEFTWHLSYAQTKERTT